MFRERRNPHDLFCSDVLSVSDLHADEGGESMIKLNSYDTQIKFAIERYEKLITLLEEKSRETERGSFSRGLYDGQVMALGIVIKDLKQILELVE